MSTDVPAARPWLFGPVRDLAFGCGAAYVVLFAVLALAGDAVRAAVPMGLTFLLITFVSLPHYGATLLRVYEKGEDRRRYRFFAVWTTIALAGLFVWGLRNAGAASWLATVYLTWSPWHYAGQNFGIGMMFLRRSAVDVSPLARRLYWWSFALSFGLTLLALHGEMPDATYAPGNFNETALSFHPLGIPRGAQGVALAVVATAYVSVTAGAFWLLARRTSLRNLTAPAMLVLSQALWFTAPALARHAGVLSGVEPLGLGHAEYVFIWIALAHAAQYLWITSYYAARSGGTRRHAGFFVKCLVAGAAIWTIPGLLFAPNALGRLPYDAGLALLIASCVNLHHFVLDGAIWKLRDGRIARILLGGASAEGAPPERRGRRIAPWIAAAGAVCLGVTLYAGFETEFGFSRAIARGDVRAATSSAERLARIGRDGADMHIRIADGAAKAGDPATARRHFEDSIRLHPSAWAYIGLGRGFAAEADWSPAASAFAHALELEPAHAVALLYAGVVDSETGRDAAGRAKILRARDVAQDPEVQREIAKVMSLYDVR